MSKKPTKPAGDGRTPPVQFRLSEETLAKLDHIAAHAAGIPLTRADAVRLAVNEKYDRMKSEKKGK